MSSISVNAFIFFISTLRVFLFVNFLITPDPNDKKSDSHSPNLEIAASMPGLNWMNWQR